MFEEIVRDNDPFVSRIRAHVQTVVVDASGLAIQSSLDQQNTLSYSANMKSLAAQARSAVRDLDSTNDLKFLRMGTRKNEVMIGVEDEFTLIAIQTITNTE